MARSRSSLTDDLYPSEEAANTPTETNLPLSWSTNVAGRCSRDARLKAPSVNFGLRQQEFLTARVELFLDGDPALNFFLEAGSSDFPVVAVVPNG